MIHQLRTAIVLFILLSLITGLAYPLIVTGIAQVVFQDQANGSLVERDGRVVGSELIGQLFDDPRYFWGRPSATTPPYDGGNSSGSNLGPTNPNLLKAVSERVEIIRRAHPEQTGLVPTDLVTTSASGLDPHISPAAAEYQAVRVAHNRQLPVDTVRRLIVEHTEGRTFGVLGEPRVNVVLLNFSLDRVLRRD